MTAIVVENLKKTFPREGRPAVDSVSFAVEAGELLVLLGPSGCGKTTLLKMINRLYEPDDGQLLVNGQDARAVPVEQLRRGIGYVIQATGLFPHMRIAENIAVVPRLLGWEQGRIDARTNELLELVGLPLTYRTRFPRQLSGGEQQRVGLARALAADPPIMLMDEPFGAIDAITRTRLQDELLRIQRRLHKTILFVTHDVEEALRLADRILIMRAGKLVQLGTPLDIMLRPANTFVQELLGTEDMLRRLSLVTVETAINGAAPVETGALTADTIALGDDLRSALGHLLRSADGVLTVVNGEGQAVGRLGFDEIRSAVLPERQKA
jgi:osmoprotectant transport system ATP-binding protein